MKEPHFMTTKKILLAFSFLFAMNTLQAAEKISRGEVLGKIANRGNAHLRPWAELIQNGSVVGGFILGTGYTTYRFITWLCNKKGDAHKDQLTRFVEDQNNRIQLLEERYNFLQRQINAQQAPGHQAQNPEPAAAHANSSSIAGTNAIRLARIQYPVATITQPIRRQNMWSAIPKDSEKNNMKLFRQLTQ